jgi:hypothetical protein
VHASVHVLAANTNQPYTWAVMADADTKLSHYAGTATATSHLPHKVDTYFSGAGGLDSSIQSRYMEGTLTLKHVMRDAGGAGDDGDNSSDHQQCTAHLHCARPSVVTSAAEPCDVKGVVGWVCPHGIPLQGMFCNMPTVEQFCYYLLSLARLVQQRAELGRQHGSATGAAQPSKLHVYIDFGCRFKITWGRYSEAGQAEGLQDCDVCIMVNWMHGSSHDVACQLQNCGRFILGAGRCDGEHAERLWSLLKVRACQDCTDSSTCASSIVPDPHIMLLATGRLRPHALHAACTACGPAVIYIV